MTESAAEAEVALSENGAPLGAPYYELIDLTTGSVIGAYTTTHAAAGDILQALQDGGDDAVLTLALGLQDPTGQTDGILIAAGADLIRWFRANR